MLTQRAFSNSSNEHGKFCRKYRSVSSHLDTLGFINAFCSCQFSLSLCAVLELGTCDWDLECFGQFNSVYLRACEAS